MFLLNKKLIFARFLSDNSYFFLVSAISLSLIVWIIQAVNFLDFVTEDGHGLGVYFSYTILNFPKIFSKLMPVIFFLSLYYTINKFNEKNELQIFWLNGINKIQFINVLINYALIFFIIQIFFNCLIVPHAQKKARTFIQDSNIDFFPSLIKEKKFIDTVDKLTIYIENKDDQNNFKNIYLKEDEGEKNIGDQKFYDTRIITAKKGKLISFDKNRYLELLDGKIMNINENKITIINFEKTNFDLNKFVTKSTIKFKTQELGIKLLVNCFYSFYFLNNFYTNEKLNCNEGSIGVIKQELVKRIIEPTYYFALVGCLGFLLLNFKESYNNRFIKVSSFLSGFLILILSEVSISLSGKSDIHSIIAIVLPLILFFLFYLIIKKKLDRINFKNIND